MVKFFYLADREHLVRFGRPITSENYFALPYGPVASTAMDLVEGDKWIMKKAGIESLPFKTAVAEVNGKPIVYIKEPLRDVNFELFSKSDIKIFDEIIERYGDKTFDELYTITHDHFAYKRAWQNRKPGSNRAEMFYEEMIDDLDLRESVMEDLEPVAAYME
jgi:uncharacterized phage-associated protein